jgi:hypothetical protein
MGHDAEDWLLRQGSPLKGVPSVRRGGLGASQGKLSCDPNPTLQGKWNDWRGQRLSFPFRELETMMERSCFQFDHHCSSRRLI